MGAGKAINARLRGQADAAPDAAGAAVNAAVAGRIRPLRADGADGFPRVLYHVAGTERDKTYAGGSGMVSRQLTVYVEAMKYGDAEQVANLVRAALDDKQGTWGGVEVLGVFLEDESEDEDTDEEAGVTVHTREQTYLIWTREAAS